MRFASSLCTAAAMRIWEDMFLYFDTNFSGIYFAVVFYSINGYIANWFFARKNDLLKAIMSNIQEMPDKNLTLTNPIKTKKKNKKWTLLLVGNYGEVISVRNFIGLMSAFLIALIIAVIAAVVLFFIYKKTDNEVERLKSAFKAAQNQVFSLKEEKDLLLVRLVVAEEENKVLKSKTKPVKKSKQTQDAALKKNKTKTPLKHKNKQSKKNIKKKPDIKPAIAAEKKVIFKVAVDNFLYSISADNKIIKTQFKLINKNSKTRAASGYTFVLLKNREIDKNKWFIFPQVAILSGKPAQLKKGRFFSISRYNIIQFMQKVPVENIESFNEAIVFVYALNGDLLLEKVFPFSIKLNPVKAPLAIKPGVKEDDKMPVQEGQVQKVFSAEGNIQPEIVNAEKSAQVTKPDMGE